MFLLLFLLFSAVSLQAEENTIPKQEMSAPRPMDLAPNWLDYLNEPSEMMPERSAAILKNIESYGPLISSLEHAEKFYKRSAEIAAQLTALNYLSKYKIDEYMVQVWLPKENYTLDEYIQISDIIRNLSKEINLKKNETSKLKSSSSALRQNLNNTFVHYSGLNPNSLEKFMRGLDVLSIGLRMKAGEIELSRTEHQIIQIKNKLKRYEEERNIIDTRLNLDVSYQEIQKTSQEIRQIFQSIQTRILELEKNNAALASENRNDHALRINQLTMTGLQIQEKTYKAQLRFLEAKELLSELMKSKDPVDYTQTVHPFRSFIDNTLIQISNWETEGMSEIDSIGKEIVTLLNKAQIQTKSDHADDSAKQNPALVAMNTPSEFVNTNKTSKDTMTRAPYEETLKLSLSNRAYLDDLNKQIHHLELILNIINQRVAIKETFFQQFLYYSDAFIQVTYTSIHEWLDFSLFDIAGTPITLVGILKCAMIILLTFWLSNFTNNGLEKLTKGRKHSAEPTVYILKRIIHYLFIFTGILIGLASLGLTLQNVAIVLGALGIGIGFGLQSIVNNFLSGLTILFERNIKIGDYIELENGKSGKVLEINIQNTSILTSEGTDILIPNSSIIDTNIINWTKRDPFQRLHIPFSVAYGTDQELVSTAACEAAEKVPATLINAPGIPKPEVWLVKFADSSLDFELVVWVNIFHSGGKSSLKASYLSELERSLRAYHINIPFPQREIYIRTPASENIPK